MSDGDPCDADFDVGHFLNFPSPEDHPYGLSEPAEGNVGGSFQYAPATEQVQGLPAPATEIHGQPPPATGIHDHPAPLTQNVAPEVPAIYGAEHYEAAPINNAAEHYEAAPAINAYDHHMAGMYAEQQYEEMAIDVQPTHMLAPEIQQGYGFPDPTLGQGDGGVHGENYQYQAPIMDAYHQYAAAPPVNGEHYQLPIMNAEHHHQVPAMDIGQYQAMAVDVQQRAHMHQAYGLPDPTPMQGEGGVDDVYHEAPAIVNAEHYQAAPINAEHHQVAATDGEPQYQAMDVQPPANMLAPETQQAYGHPEPTPMQGGGGVDAVHYEAPPINAQHNEAPAFNDGHHQVQAMAMDVVEQPTHAPAAGTQMPQAPGALPDPTPMPQQGGGVDGAPWLEGESMFPPPSPTMCRMLDELADMLQEIDGAEGNAGGGAEAAAPDGDEEMGPADEEITFKPIVPGRLDCGRCRSVRGVLALHGVSKIHFAVHTTYPGTFDHAIIDRMIMDPDGQFRTKVLLFLDLRGRRHEWVQNFIAKSVEQMKTKNAGLVQDSCGPSTSYGAAAAGYNNITGPHPSTAVGDNNISAPLPRNHGHMELEVGMLNNLLSATAATADQAAIPEAAQPAQAQGNTDAHAPSVAEAAIIPEAAPSEAAHPSVAQAQENTDHAPSVAEAAAAPEASPTEAAQPSATLQAQGSPPSVANEAQAPAAAHQPAADAFDRFPPFNWEGFRPDHILESSQVPPYDPASGVDVLMYPSMQEHLRVEALKREEGKRLSKMTVEDTPDYLNINEDHLANAPNFASALFKLLCQKDPTYRMFKRRVSGLNRKIRKLEQGATRVGTGGLFKIKQKMETFKGEKEELYDVINRGMQELENARRGDDGAGPSNRPGPSNGAGPSSNGAGPSSSNVAGFWNNDAGTSNVTGNSNDSAGPSNVAGTSNEDAGPSNVVAAGTNEDAGPSSTAGPSGTK